MVTFKDVNKEDIEFLKEFGFYEEKTKTKYESLRLKGPLTIILFDTKRLLLQGKDETTEKYKKLLIKKGLKEIKPIEFVKETGTIIGSDESLKGDTFGGLVVAAVKADDKQRQMLKFAGVMDSKKLKDFEIKPIAERIKKIAKYSVISMLPKEYNKSSMTDLLNLMHRKVIDDLGKSDLNVVDEFPGLNLENIKSVQKAESKYVEVAAASILAREAALEQLDKLSKKAKMKLPKGSTHVKEALLQLKKKKLDIRTYVKTHFKNVREIWKDKGDE